MTTASAITPAAAKATRRSNFRRSSAERVSRRRCGAWTGRRGGGGVRDFFATGPRRIPTEAPRQVHKKRHRLQQTFRLIGSGVVMPDPTDLSAHRLRLEESMRRRARGQVVPRRKTCCERDFGRRLRKDRRTRKERRTWDYWTSCSAAASK